MIATSYLLAVAMLQPTTLEVKFAEIEKLSKGELGAAVITAKSRHYSRKAERFSLQSVMKLMVSMAALDRVDRGLWKLNQPFTFRRSDLSLSAQSLSERLGNRNRMTVTVAECIEATVTESCSAAGDFLIRKLGGTRIVNDFFKKHQIVGMSVDRQERDLQTNIEGFSWRPEFVDSKRLDAASDRVSASAKDAAYKRYQSDPRDTTTPSAMGQLLQKLVTGKLLSASSTRYLMGVMERTVTGEDRLKAGVPAAWKLGHKTGTSSTHKGVACATNDVGYVRNEKGEWVIIVALLKNSTLNPAGRASILRQVAEAALKHVP